MKIFINGTYIRTGIEELSHRQGSEADRYYTAILSQS